MSKPSDERVEAIPSTFGQILRIWRTRRGMTLRELAEGAGLNYTYICKVERNQAPVPSVDALHALAQSLDIPGDDMFRAAKRLPEKHTTPELEALIWDLRDTLDVATACVERLERDNERLREFADYVAPAMYFSSCFHGPEHPKADAVFHCCDWAEAVRQYEALTAAADEEVNNA